MDASPIVLSPETSVRTAIVTFNSERISGAPVIDRAGKLLGMVSEFDLLLQAATQDLDSPIAFKKEVLGLRPSDTLKEALMILYKHRIRRLPVVGDNGMLVGVVARIHVLNQIVGVTATEPTD